MTSAMRRARRTAMSWCSPRTTVAMRSGPANVTGGCTLVPPAGVAHAAQLAVQAHRVVVGHAGDVVGDAQPLVIARALAREDGREQFAEMLAPQGVPIDRGSDEVVEEPLDRLGARQLHLQYVSRAIAVLEARLLDPIQLAGVRDRLAQLALER